MFSRLHYLLLTSVVTLASSGVAIAASPPTKEVEVNGIRMAYVEEGTGEPVVFVHGAVSDARAWEPIREAIADQYRFIAPTLRYFGAGQWPDKGERFGVTTHADDVAAFLSALDVGQVHLVGWSYGGTVAAAAALKNPDLVQSLILFEPPLPALVKEGEAGDAAWEAAGKMFDPVTTAIEEGDDDKATKLLIEGVFQLSPGGFERQPQERQTMQLENARTMPLLWSDPLDEVTCDMLKALDKPTLIIHGAESNAYWVHIAEVTDECMPQAEVAAQPKVNHDGPVRDPVGLAAMIDDFVTQH
jgi:pimeloyl-ACP methyl ester carboxylesterase